MRWQVARRVFRKRIEAQTGGAVALALANVPGIRIAIPIGVDRCGSIERERILGVGYTVAIAIVAGHVNMKLNRPTVDDQHRHSRVRAHDAQCLSGIAQLL